MRPRSSTTAARIVSRSGSPLSRPASSRNQRSRSSHGTAAFAGEVDGRTKSFVSAERSAPADRARAARRTRRDTPPCRRRRATAAAARARSARAARPSRRSRRAAGRPSRASCGRRRSSRRFPPRAGRTAPGGVVEAGRQLRRVEEPPEVVARVREVCARCGGHATRVDADEDDPEIRSEDVRHVARSRVPSGHVLGVSHSFPHGGSEAPFANGRRRAVTAGWQLRAGWSPRGLRGLGRSLCRVELRHELVGPGLDARLELAPQILTRDGRARTAGAAARSSPGSPSNPSRRISGRSTRSPTANAVAARAAAYDASRTEQGF